MADPKVQSLSQFTLSETPDGYLIEIEGDGGGAMAVTATPEQIDAIIDALDGLLSEDDHEEEPDDDVTDEVDHEDEN